MMKYDIRKINGIRHGLQCGWFENGIKAYQVLRIKGLRQGIFQGWKEFGNRELIFQNKHDLINGPHIQFKYIYTI